jgi:hypothetical protein
MSVPRMHYVLVNNMTPRNPSVYMGSRWNRATCRSRHYCGIECYRQRTVVTRFVGSIAPVTTSELAPGRS